jgi:polyisoprenyl-teichoic acid--peptidoglycan teichoic acid transferase
MFPPEMEDTRPQNVGQGAETQPHLAVAPSPRRRPGRAASLGLVLGLVAAAYFFAPIRTNVLVLGVDRRPDESTTASRSDMLILVTVVPTRPYVGMLSIPRDLWVDIPEFGPNRINAAYFLAEAVQPGTGARAAADTVRSNFGVDVHGYASLEFTGIVGFVDALGGVDIDLATATGGYGPGPHHLDGAQALAFARDRSGSDDFFRMERGQILMRSILRSMIRPASWPRWPQAGAALLTSVRTDLALWEWPRLALALVRAGSGGIDGRVIGRDMAVGFTTPAGAQVLSPDWSRINPLLLEMFGQ